MCPENPSTVSPVQPASWKDEAVREGEQAAEQERSFDSFSEVRAIIMVWLVPSPQGTQ